MKTLPYRDIDNMGSGGDVSTVVKVSRKRKPWVYRYEYDKLLKERDAYKKCFKYALWVIAALLFAQVFGDAIIKLILTV